METITVSRTVTTVTSDDAVLILPATDTTPAVVAVPEPYPFEPDYYADEEWAEVVLAWDRGWNVAHATDGTHAIDPERVAEALGESAYLCRRSEVSPTALLTRYLNAFSPDNISYRVERHYGYSQGDEFIVISAYPTGHADDLAPSRYSPGLNWARGSVQRLAALDYDAETDTYTERPASYRAPIYGESWDLNDYPDLEDEARAFLDELEDFTD